MNSYFDFVINGDRLEKVIFKYDWPDCPELEIPANVKVIGKNAFEKCSKVNRIIFNDCIEVLEDGAFKNCGHMYRADLPDTLKEIGQECFSGCRRLYQVHLGPLVEKIGAGAFKDCVSIESFEIPIKVTEIKDETFCGCGKLKQINMHNNINRIGKFVFRYCTSLKTIIFPDSIDTIGTMTCANCTNLTEVIVPNKLKEIENFAFRDCKNLSYFYYMEPNSKNLIELKKEFNNGFIIFPDTLESIGSQAFFDCEKFENLILPKNINFIGTEAFYDCKSLKYIKLNNENLSLSPDYINYSLYLCDPKTLSSHNRKKFITVVIDLLINQKYPNLKYKKDWEDYIKNHVINNLELLINEKYLDYLIREKLIECKAVPKILEKINDNVELSARVMDYQNKNFSVNEIIKSNEIKIHLKSPNSAAELGKIWNYEPIDDENIIITGYKGNSNNVTVPEKIGKKRVLAISNGCFSSDAIRLNKSKENRNNIKKITFSEGIEIIGQHFNNNVAAGSFEGCVSLSEIIFPKSIKSIENKRTFFNCAKLKKIKFLGSIENISMGVLDKNLKLKELILESQPSRSFSQGFEALKSVKKLVLGEDISILYKGMFGKCSELKSVEYKNPNIKFEENSLPKIFFISNFTPNFIEGEFSLLLDNNFSTTWINNLDLDKKNIWYNYMQQELYNVIVSTSKSSKLILSELIEGQLLTIDDAANLIELLNNTNSDEAIQAEKINMLKTASLVPENSKDFFQYHLKAIRRIMINI